MRGEFPSLKIIDAKKSNTFQTLEEVCFIANLNSFGIEKHVTILVPANTVTDLASIPRFMPMRMHKNRIASPAIIHDMLYTKEGKEKHPDLTRKMADRIFLHAMLCNDVAKLRANLYYIAVRAFGWIGYGNPQRN